MSRTAPWRVCLRQFHPDGWPRVQLPRRLHDDLAVRVHLVVGHGAAVPELLAANEQLHDEIRDAGLAGDLALQLGYGGVDGDELLDRPPARQLNPQLERRPWAASHQDHGPAWALVWHRAILQQAPGPIVKLPALEEQRRDGSKARLLRDLLLQHIDRVKLLHGQQQNLLLPVLDTYLEGHGPQRPEGRPEGAGETPARNGRSRCP
mmetsp:Transcript_92952/g.284513  ORF Transcript_92952/g.284513 Transcript_92952/m.284513 type:complete len:206 (+) Transcript_92952:65-682(+)